MLEHTINTKIL